MQFLITGKDGTDDKALERRLTAREKHIALGNQMKERGEMLYAVALLNKEGEMCGSVIVCKFDSHAELDSYLEKEPYVLGKVWESIDITECKVGKSFEELS